MYESTGICWLLGWSRIGSVFYNTSSIVYRVESSGYKLQRMIFFFFFQFNSERGILSYLCALGSSVRGIVLYLNALCFFIRGILLYLNALDFFVRGILSPTATCVFTCLILFTNELKVLACLWYIASRRLYLGCFNCDVLKRDDDRVSAIWSAELQILSKSGIFISWFSLSLSLSLYIYIYMYMYVYLCVCIYM